MSLWASAATTKLLSSEGGGYQTTHDPSEDVDVVAERARVMGSGDSRAPAAIVIKNLRKVRVGHSSDA